MPILWRYFDPQFIRTLAGVTHRAHKPDLLLLKSNKAMDLWITPERHRNLPTNFSDEANKFSLEEVFKWQT